jgi:hypothetical protein
MQRLEINDLLENTEKSPEKQVHFDVVRRGGFIFLAILDEGYILKKPTHPSRLIQDGGIKK